MNGSDGQRRRIIVGKKLCLVKRISAWQQLPLLKKAKVIVEELESSEDVATDYDLNDGMSFLRQLEFG